MTKKQKFIDKARSIHGYKYEYIEYENMKNPIKILLNDVIYYQDPRKHLMGRCPEKNTPKITEDDFRNKCQEIWGDRFLYKTPYNGALSNITFIDRETGVEYEQRANSHLSGTEPFKKMTTIDFINLSREKYGDDYEYSLTKYSGYHNKLKVIFAKTGKIFEQTPSNHLFSGHRPERINRRTNESFIEDSNIIHNFKYNYDKSNYDKSKTKLIITCPIHGDFEQTPNSHLQGYGCHHCNESRGEREILKFLKKYNINYIRQYKFTGCRNIFELPFNFYIPSSRSCIEFDGIQHHQPVSYFGGVESYKALKINDKIKNDYCEDNFIILIRIRYDQIDEIFKILYENFKNRIKNKY